MSDILDWIKAENIAALIEKTISPDAHVQHNVQLPVIGTTRTRQCDVVIYFGNPPRQTVAIVEVQKRKRKPDITTFHGWIRKMQEVGAQQLFCVSALGYPKSIIDDVKSRIGPTVKLLTMEDLASVDRTSPFMLAPFLLDTSPKYQITDIGTPKAASTHDTSLSLNTAERIISIGSRNERYSLDELISTALNNVPDLPQPGNKRVRHDICARLFATCPTIASTMARLPRFVIPGQISEYHSKVARMTHRLIRDDRSHETPHVALRQAYTLGPWVFSFP